MNIYLKVNLCAMSKQEMLSLLNRLIERIEQQPHDTVGQWRYEWTNIPKDKGF